MIQNQHSKRMGWLYAGLCACCFVGGVILFLLMQPSAVLTRSNGGDQVHEQASIKGMVSSTKQEWINGTSFLIGATPFWTGEPETAQCTQVNEKAILILPHYLPLHDRIEKTLSTWIACAGNAKMIRHVVVISPDHYRRLSSGSATLSEDGYSTPLGAVVTDPGVRQSFIEAGVVSTQELFIREHGAGIFPVFIKKYFPNATYTPIVISNKTTKAELLPVLNRVQSMLEAKDTLVIVTADFSHYLSEEEADKRDQETISAFQQKDTAFFWTATDDYTDFGRGLWFAWQLAGITSSVQIVDRVNSGDIGGSKTNTTSFFLGWWK